MDPLENMVRTHPIQTGRKRSIEPYVNGDFGFIDDPDLQCGDILFPPWTRT
jgi:hypothetical protein